MNSPMLIGCPKCGGLHAHRCDQPTEAEQKTARRVMRSRRLARITAQYRARRGK